MQAADHHNMIAVNDVAALVYGNYPVGVTVVGDSQIGTVL